MIGWRPVTPRSCVTVAEIHRAASITALSRLAYSLASDTPPSPKGSTNQSERSTSLASLATETTLLRAPHEASDPSALRSSRTLEARALILTPMAQSAWERLARKRRFLSPVSAASKLV